MPARASPEAQPLADLASLFLARAQPLLPLPPASQSRLPCTLQSLRRRHRRQFCSPQPWQLEGQQYTTTTTSHTPRWPAPSAPHGPAQPPFASAIASSASNQVAPSSSANAAAAPRQRPGRLADLQPAMPPPPHRLGSTSSTAVSNLEGFWVGPLFLDIPRRQLRLPGTDLATELDGLGFFYPTTKVRLFRLTHSPSPALFSGCSVLRASPLPHTPFLCRACTSKADVYRPRVPFICSCVMKHDR